MMTRARTRKASALRRSSAGWAVVASLLSSAGAGAQTVADFYQGKTITLVVSTSAGGDYDTRARLLARHMGRFMPALPKTIVQNMPGGGGLRGANWLYNIAAQDGTALAALQQQIPLSQLFGKPGVEYDVTRLHFIGNTSASPIVIMAWSASPVKSFADLYAHDFVVGGTGAGSASVQIPLMLSSVLGARFKVVPGYPGGSEIYLAMERGEVAGRATQSWAGWRSQKPEWISEGKIRPLAQGGRKRHAELKDTPLLTELARNEEDRKLIELMLSSDEVARPILAAQGTPPDRVAALRTAFLAAVRDADFDLEAKKLGVDIEAMSGEEAQSIVAEMMAAPPSVVERAKKFADTGG